MEIILSQCWCARSFSSFTTADYKITMSAPASMLLLHRIPLLTSSFLKKKKEEGNCGRILKVEDACSCCLVVGPDPRACRDNS